MTVTVTVDADSERLLIFTSSRYCFVPFHSFKAGSLVDCRGETCVCTRNRRARGHDGECEIYYAAVACETGKAYRGGDVVQMDEGDANAVPVTTGWRPRTSRGIPFRLNTLCRSLRPYGHLGSDCRKWALARGDGRNFEWHLDSHTGFDDQYTILTYNTRI